MFEDRSKLQLPGFGPPWAYCQERRKLGGKAQLTVLIDFNL